MLAQIRPALLVLILLTIITGLVYPLVMTGVAGVLFPYQAQGSLVTDSSGKVIGSALIGQQFSSDKYFHGRPSATTGTDAKGNTVPQPYNASNSMGSNLGPTSQALHDRVQAEVENLRTAPDANPPADLVTTSASGLDPHISPEAAFFQVQRVAKARGLSPDSVHGLVEAKVKTPLLGFLGEPRVNVLLLNRALDTMTEQGAKSAP